MQVGKLTPTDLGIAMMTLADAGILHIPLIRKLQKVGCALRGDVWEQVASTRDKTQGSGLGCSWDLTVQVLAV